MIGTLMGQKHEFKHLNQTRVLLGTWGGEMGERDLGKALRSNAIPFRAQLESRSQGGRDEGERFGSVSRSLLLCLGRVKRYLGSNLA